MFEGLIKVTARLGPTDRLTRLTMGCLLVLFLFSLILLQPKYMLRHLMVLVAIRRLAVFGPLRTLGVAESILLTCPKLVTVPRHALVEPMSALSGA